MKLPWKVLHQAGVYPGSQNVTLALQIKVDGHEGVNLNDVLAPGARAELWPHRHPDIWGPLRFLQEGCVKRPDPVMASLWQEVQISNTAPVLGVMHDAHFFSEKEGIAVGREGLLRTEDGGVSWRKIAISKEISFSETSRHGKDRMWAMDMIAATGGSAAYVVSRNYAKDTKTQLCSIVKTTDAGATWTLVKGDFANAEAYVVSFSDEGDFSLPSLRMLREGRSAIFCRSHSITAQAGVSI